VWTSYMEKYTQRHAVGSTVYCIYIRWYYLYYSFIHHPRPAPAPHLGQDPSGPRTYVLRRRVPEPCTPVLGTDSAARGLGWLRLPSTVPARDPPLYL
jgi:hypothetical protein